MNCTLMHKRLAVADIEIDDATGFIQKVHSLYASAHLPLGTLPGNGIIDRTALNDWWIGRSIPASRSGVREALEALELSSPKLLLTRCYGLSLSDHYWICPADSGLTWDDINFFDNPFSDDMGDVLFGRQKSADFDFSSPDNTSDGFLKKRWKIMNGKRCLIKGGSNPFQQQPFNEVIAAAIMERLVITHTDYTLIWSDGYPYSVCEDFVTQDTELVSAWRVMCAAKKDNSTSVYRHFINCCQAQGLTDIVSSLDQMLVLDYIIANEDRHLNNFGLLRDLETLRWIGFAPIFDSGSSLGYDKTAGQISAERDILCKPFKRQHIDQLKLVSSFDWINFDALDDVPELIRSILSDDNAASFVGRDRIDAIAASAEKRIAVLQDMAMTQTPGDQTHSTDGDVEEDLAENYTQNMSI